MEYIELLLAAYGIPLVIVVGVYKQGSKTLKLLPNIKAHGFTEYTNAHRNQALLLHG